MQRRVSASGRPSGTDGSDYSYQMVVDFCLLLLLFQSASEDLASRGLEIATTAGGLISLIIGALVFRIHGAESSSYWEIVLELPEISLAVVGLVFHLFIIGYTLHLIANMSVPKRAS
ncbi:hypothetical protein F3Y22_tig00117056pilonHSYRG00937 [Hibiscus syriacus]|uniref:Uncharacterized protein n=1 Tax=Hibiscus syriacus TaxID=106335 RepID=A0A6A2WWJ9_HIBSY|nr:hypothetical protein F3Y22_tig00117056pilonHSYRG00937 [Hibiscus syriacus]